MESHQCKSITTDSSTDGKKCCTKYPVQSPPGFVPLSQNKIQFESKIPNYYEEKGATICHPTFRKFGEGECPFMNSTFRSKSKEIIFYCDWTPKLFGIDEDEIPPSEDEEMFEVDIEELRHKALHLSESTMAMLRKCNENMTDDELREAWIENNIPKYARRVRRKPILERDHHERFECICNIDLFYCRHHIPRFSEGVKEGEELRVPHFKAYWDQYRERGDLKDVDRWSAIIEVPPQDIKEPGENPFRSFFNKSYSKETVKELRRKLLASFRPLDCREVRRHRMSFAEALYLELQEDGYQEAALFFKYLLIKDYFLHDAPENTNPALRQCKGKLLKLMAFLKLAEKYSKTREYHIEATVLVRTGKYFNDHDENWWWLAEEFYTRAVKVSQKSVIDGGKSEAVSRFMLGMYLLEYASRAELANEHFSRALELCMGKDWTAEKFFNQKQEFLYKECVNYFCRVLIIQSQQLRKNNKPNEALPLIHRSYKLCEASKARRDIEMETYFELGMTYQDVGFMNWAKIAFRKFIEIAKEENYTRRVCDGFLEMAICHRSEGDMDMCQQNLHNYLHTAEAKQDENLIAYGHQYLGEFHLHNGNSAEAMKHFNKAFTSFYNQLTEAPNIPFEEWKLEHFALIYNLQLNRCMLGLAKGDLLTIPIYKLILSAKNSKNQAPILDLIRWKNKGILNRNVNEDIGQPQIETWGAVTEVTAVLENEAKNASDLDLGKTVRFAIEEDEVPIQ